MFRESWGRFDGGTGGPECLLTSQHSQAPASCRRAKDLFAVGAGRPLPAAFTELQVTGNAQGAHAGALACGRGLRARVSAPRESNAAPHRASATPRVQGGSPCPKPA